MVAVKVGVLSGCHGNGKFSGVWYIRYCIVVQSDYRGLFFFETATKLHGNLWYKFGARVTYHVKVLPWQLMFL